MFVLGASFWARYLEVARLELLALTTLETNDPATRARLEAKGDTALAIQLVARLKPDELVSSTISLEQINEDLDQLRSGTVARTLVIMRQGEDS